MNHVNHTNYLTRIALTFLASIITLVSSPTSSFANTSAFGYCQQGNQTVTTGSLTSTTKVQRSYPQCTVTVYLTGTGTLATLYSNNSVSPTPLANPFTANSNGTWQFYAVNGRYDIVLSGAGIGSPFTISDVLLDDPLYRPVMNNIQYCDPSSSAVESTQISNAIAALPSTGGVIVCSGLLGAQSWSANPFASVGTKPIDLYLSSGTVTISLDVTIPYNVTIHNSSSSILSISSTKTLTIQSNIVGPRRKLFAGSGTISISNTPGQVNIYPEWFGAIGDGSTDDTSAFQSMSASCGSGRCYFQLAASTYKITDEITFSKDRVCVVGSGQQATQIDFEPLSGGKSAFKFTKNSGATRMVQTCVRELGFTSNDTTYKKIALNIGPTSDMDISGVATYPWTGNTSIGILFSGNTGIAPAWSELIRVSGNTTISADIPVQVSYGLDHSSLVDTYLLAPILLVTTPVILVDDGLAITNVDILRNAWVGGKYGIFWDDTTSAGADAAFTIRDVRWEQSSDTTGYAIYINQTGAGSLQKLLIENFYGSFSNGLYLHGIVGAIIQNISLTSITTVNWDFTGQDFYTQNITGDPAKTTNDTSTRRFGSYLLGGNLYVVSGAPIPGTGAAYQWSQNPSTTLGFPQLEPKPIVVTAGANVKLSDDTLNGMLFISSTGGLSCIMNVNDAFHSTTVLVSGGACGASAGASSYNVYWNGGTNSYRIQNNTGFDATLYLMFFGKGEH